MFKMIDVFWDDVFLPVVMVGCAVAMLWALGSLAWQMNKVERCGGFHNICGVDSWGCCDEIQ